VTRIPAPRPPPCKECGDPCIDAGPGLGWQCVSDKPHPSTDGLRFVDPRDAELSTLRAELAEVRRERDVAHDIRRQLQAENVRLFSANLAAIARAEQLAGDLNIARLQRDAKLCSECPRAGLLEAAERDAARYRWLRGNGAIISRAAEIPVQYAHHGIGLDAAIDAQLALSTQPTASEGEKDMPIRRCPKCDDEQPDMDGFGVLHCEHCGFCTHASITNGKCDLCGHAPDGSSP
jgi:hypothetical protein